MREYRCTGTCCPNGRALPPTNTPIQTAEGEIVIEKISCYQSAHGEASVVVELKRGLCTLRCIKTLEEALESNVKTLPTARNAPRERAHG